MTSLKIAIQFLWRDLIKTCITLIAVSLGFAIFYFILDVSSGLEYVVLHTTAENDAHIRIQTIIPFESFDNEDAKTLRQDLFSLSHEISDVSFSYRTLVTNFSITNDTIFELRGFDFNYGKNISDIESRLAYRPDNKTPETVTDPSLDYDGEIAVGYLFLKHRVGYDLGSKITVYNSENEPFVLKIVAVFSSDQNTLSANVFFTTIETAQMIGNASIINSIEIRTKNPQESSKVTPLIKAYSETHFDSFIINDWQEGNQTIINLLYIEEISVFLIQFMTGLAIAFGVGAVIMFQAKQKINQIGILKALGYKDFDAQMIFFYQALIITILGLIIGLTIGVSMGSFFTNTFRRGSGVPLVPLQTNFINFYSILTLAIMLPTNLIASLIPLRFVKNLKIIEVIKHE